MALGLSNQAPDVEHLEPMVQRSAATAGTLPDVLTADAGYWSEANTELCAEQVIDAYISMGRLPHGQPLPPKRGPMPKDADVKALMARKFRSNSASAIYA